ncbi:hypothetical protein [Flavisolibacter ginsenosidimutans]|uniref:Type VI secretion system baseplate subunit TssK n=1 Tax=Flavisolibacter ginsenosidimutans TaxID=661481 RepID=A0A5B8UJQ9_9BACT|nr:hypothetical protein [Flavisolibacter ginsenosidimutans]QEC56808.1 hypothetical protein FSB75_13170 [Flavisolibacter ginsenosidimutans]
MRDRLQHYFVNWVDGMKINKSHFVAQNNAIRDVLHDATSLHLTPHRYGVLPPSVAGENTFSVRVSLDNQNTLRVVVEACQAVTPGGVRISLPAFQSPVFTEADVMPATLLPFSAASGELDWWIVLIVHPYETKAAGAPDLSENPPRFPFEVPSYTIEVVPQSQYKQFTYYPYALTVGKLFVANNEINLVDFYIPPCYSVNAHPELIALLGEFDTFLSSLERHCTVIVQKIFKKSQQNDVSELVMFLCDRVMLYLGQALTAARWNLLYESPAALFFTMASLARVLKNTVDLRIGAGKDELMEYLSEWCELKQGELESMLASIAGMNYDHNDVNKNISEAAVFVRVIAKLFGTLSRLEFIGKRRSGGFVVKEEAFADELPKKTSKPRFLG